MSLLDTFKFERIKPRKRQPAEIPPLAYLRTEKTVRIIVGADLASSIGIKHLTGIEISFHAQQRLLCISIDEQNPMTHARSIYNDNAYELKSNLLRGIPEDVLPMTDVLTDLAIDEVEMVHFIAHAVVPEKKAARRADPAVPYTGKKRGRPKKNAVPVGAHEENEWEGEEE